MVQPPILRSVEKKVPDQEMTAKAKRDAQAPKPLRADAQRNRDRLVEVAAQAFAADGVDASLEEIAKRAGVGIGTLYRHFPTREHLVEVVYRREVEGLCHAAEELAREHAADVALELWMQRFVDYIATKRGLATSLRLLLTTNSTLFSDTSGRVSGAMRSLIEAAAASGKIRADVDASDVMHALGGIYSAPNTPDWRERSGRLVKLLMDGLRFGARG